MATLNRPRIEYRTPLDLIDEVRAGLLRIPTFQRGFKWESADVIALFDSIWHGFPIGNLLLWRRPAPAATVQVGPITISAPELDSALWVVDGQQRITSLVGALTAADSATDSRFRVHLDLEEERFHSLGVRQEAPLHWIPVSRLIDMSELLAWMRTTSWLTDSQIAVAESAAKAIREYQVPTYVVTTDDEIALRRIFDRLNNTGKPMTRAEVFHALHAGLAGDEADDLHAIGAVAARLGFGRIDDRLALRCVLAYRGGDIFREDFQHEFSSAEDRQSTFREVSAALRAVVEFLQNDVGIPHGRLLPYSHVVPALIRFVRVHGAPRDRVAHLLRRWVWRDAVAGSAARSTSVAAIRQAVAAAGVTDPYQAAQTLLRSVPVRPDFRADLEKVHLNHAATKINLLGLASRRPRDLGSGEPLDIASLFDTSKPLRTVVKSDSEPLASTFANLVIVGAVPGRSLRAALGATQPETAESHLVDADGQRLLSRGDFTRFLQRRQRSVAEAVESHVAAMAEWGARDGRTIAELIRSAA